MLNHIVEKVTFAAGLLTGSQLPKFIGDYRQYLGGQLEQAKWDLALFQDIANRFHGGSLEALIQKHLNSKDLTFHAEGLAIEKLETRVEQLTEAAIQLQGNLFEQIASVTLNRDLVSFKSTWQAFEPGVLLTSEAIACAFAGALLLSLSSHLLVRTKRRLFRRKSKSSMTDPGSAR